MHVEYLQHIYKGFIQCNKLREICQIGLDTASPGTSGSSTRLPDRDILPKSDPVICFRVTT